MIEHVHYASLQVHCPTAENATARLLLAIAAARGYPVEHFDIKDAYVHEPASSPQPIYVSALPKCDDTVKYRPRTGLLLKNLWGGKSAGYAFIQPLFAHLRADGYIPSDTDPCLFTKQDSRGITAVTITVDDFLAMASTASRLDDFHRLLAKKYTVERLGHRATF